MRFPALLHSAPLSLGQAPLGCALRSLQLDLWRCAALCFVLLVGCQAGGVPAGQLQRRALAPCCLRSSWQLAAATAIAPCCLRSSWQLAAATAIFWLRAST
jgi:hypothetical protein